MCKQTKNKCVTGKGVTAGKAKATTKLTEIKGLRKEKSENLVVKTTWETRIILSYEIAIVRISKKRVNVKLKHSGLTY